MQLLTDEKTRRFYIWLNIFFLLVTWELSYFGIYLNKTFLIEYFGFIGRKNPVPENVLCYETRYLVTREKEKNNFLELIFF